MAAQGRKNVHGKAGVRFKAGYTASKNKAMLRNVVTDLILNGEVKVTSGVTKELKSLADHLVTLAKRGDLHARRLAAQVVRTNVEKDGKNALTVLFSEIGPRMAKRNGGYTKAYKLGLRRGDSAEVNLVRWSD
ncbi:MAG: 50S ribosomal protein L17 [Bacilli bacterium]|nr:50S ribosomal protein L17 [Bacilli bacterium]